MAGIIDRLALLLEQRLEDLPVILRNAADPIKDRNGCSSGSVVGDFRFIGMALYLLNHDVAAFRAKLSESARTRFRMIERFEAGEPIDKSYVTMLNYKAIFNALAACDMETARAIASHIGGRQSIELHYDHPFDYAFGYTLRAFVLSEEKDMGYWAPEFASVCQHKGNVDFQGYAMVFQAMLDKDDSEVAKGLKEIVNGHKRQCKGKGVFRDTVDEALCVWGVGMANLARAHGLPVEGEPPLIPNDLLC